MAERKTFEHEHNDRLSAMPDTILTEILSLLPIKSAAATSALSHRWRRLWTTATRFKFTSTDEAISLDFSAIIVPILRTITSPKLDAFDIRLDSLFNFCREPVSQPCFREICGRSVEEIVIRGPYRVYEDCFLVIPEFLFKLQSLVILDLYANLRFDLVENAAIRLPNLKKLSLSCLFDVPPWLEFLINSCTLLEDLTLCFNLSLLDPPRETPECFNIFGHNLKALRIVMHSRHIPTRRTKICIDAPELKEMCINDRLSCYYFVRNPPALVQTLVTLTADEDFDEGPVVMDGQKEYVQQMSKFIQGMSSVIRLDIWVQGKPNVYNYLHRMNHGVRPVFPNLVHLDTNLDDIGLIGWKDLLLSMQCFPVLTQLDVYTKMGDNLSSESMKWFELDFAPDCLVRKLRKISIFGLNGTNDELKLLAYILSNATVLEELHIHLGSCGNLLDTCCFCSSLFKLPRVSSTCEIKFKGTCMEASSNAYKEGSLVCEIYGL